MFVLLLGFQETLYFLIEVGCNALGAVEYIVFCLCFVIGDFFGDAAYAFQDLVFPERKELAAIIIMPWKRIFVRENGSVFCE